MTVPTPAHKRLARSALVALLMTSAASAALAAPARHKARAPRADAVLASEVRELKAQVQALKAQLDAQAQAQVQPSAQAQAQQAQLDALNEQLADLKTQQTTANADIITLKAPPPVTVSLPNGKPALASSDGRFSANIKAIVMFDAGAYLQKHNLPATITGAARDLNDGTNFRRARFGIDGKLYKNFDYGLIYEFGGSGAEDAGHIQEAWLQYSGLKPFRIRLGAFEPNIGLAAAVSTSQMPLMERPAPAEVARNVAAGDSRVAFQVSANDVIGAGDTGLAARWMISTAYTANIIATGSSSAIFRPVTSRLETFIFPKRPALSLFCDVVNLKMGYPFSPSSAASQL